jgi:carboxyl-terminal processing protease
VGEPTFGSGVLLKQFPLQDGGMISLAVAKYESPSGIVIQENGVQPTVEAGSTKIADASAGAGANTGAAAKTKPSSGLSLEDSDWQVHTALQQLQKQPAVSQ